MLIEDIKAGDVFFWKDYPYQNNGQDKNRWFVFLGRTGIVDSPFFYYYQTTTTNFEDFKTGNRAGRVYVSFNATEGPFEKDCLLDVCERIQNSSPETFSKYNKQLEFKGTIPKHKINELLSKLKSKVPPKIYSDILDSFGRAGRK